MGTSSANTVIRTRHLPAPVRIVSWPLRDEGLRAWSHAIGLGAIGALCGVLAGNVAMGLFALLALVASSWRLWVPVTFDFSSRGVVQTVFRRQRRIPWPQIAQYKLYSRGVLLLADPQPTPLAALRGLYIPLRDQREQSLEVLNFFLGASRPAQGSTHSSSLPPVKRAESGRPEPAHRARLGRANESALPTDGTT